MPDAPNDPRDGAVSRAKQAFLGRLDAAVQAAGITRAELARRLGKPSATVSFWFTKARLPEGETMLALPAALGVNPGWLLLGEGGMHDAPDTGEAASRAFQAGALRAVQEMEGRLADLREALTSPATPGAPTGLDVAALAQLQGVLQPPSEPEPSNGERRHGERRSYEERRKQA